jgi:hypothetical protein
VGKINDKAEAFAVQNGFKNFPLLSPPPSWSEKGGGEDRYNVNTHELQTLLSERN